MDTRIHYEALSISVRTSIDFLCSRFEAEWKSGRPPQIEAYLDQIDAPYRPALLRELVVLEIYYRPNDLPALRSDLVRRFEGFAPIVDSAVEACSVPHVASQADQSTFVFSPIAAREVDTSAASSDPSASITFESGSDKLPTAIGRYRVLRELGRGGFGIVYEAYDGRLKRSVAIKLPRKIDRPITRRSADLVEARTLASLDHHGIVPVYDVQKTEDSRYFVVSKLIEGRDLRETLTHTPPTFEESAQIVASAAEALEYAHSRGLIHRDVKPANILIDNDGKPYVADFGLALHQEQLNQESGIAGTPLYMSPEQVRGEGHLVDQRSDIYSLGIVLYELLTRQTPQPAGYPSDTEQDRGERIVPPRQHNERIPRELERISLKAIAERAADRYATAAEFAEDLRHYLKAEQRGSEDEDFQVTIVPRGIQSYDQDDADFYLNLLPGPRDRLGLPQTVRQLKAKVDEIDPAKTFRIGIVVGPSGCGKSSLIKAGLLPRLSENVLPVYLEATHQSVATDLLDALRKGLPQAKELPDLRQLISSVRRDHLLATGQKLLLVIDQFEQWLHHRGQDNSAELVAALRQCDGGHVQCLLLVRDDFWMPTSRFMKELDEPMVEQNNIFTIDLFDQEHAGAVLAKLGWAYGKLPEQIDQASRAQQTFVRGSIDVLSEASRVVPVKLAVYAEMMRHKPWVPSTLRRTGGIKGVGVNFLEDTFSRTSAPREYQIHRQAARAVLERLLPETGQTIKGHARSRQELLEASGYTKRPDDFESLMRVLSRETRLLTVARAEDQQRNGHDDLRPTPTYQLTHDYLVPSIREWLHQGRRNSWRGRAQLRLIERTELWHSSDKQRKQLPSLMEWLNVEVFTKHSLWSDTQRELMQRARVANLGVVSASLAMVLLIAFVAHELNGRVRARSLIKGLSAAETTEVAELLDSLTPYQRWAEPHLHDLASSTKLKDRLHAHLALYSEDPSRLGEIIPLLLDGAVDTEAFLAVRSRLGPLPDDVGAQLFDGSESWTRRQQWRVACLQPRGKAWTAEERSMVVDELILACETNPALVPNLIAVFRDQHSILDSALKTAFDREGRPAELAARILADYRADSAEQLIELMLSGSPEQLSILLVPLQRLDASHTRNELMKRLEANQLTPAESARAAVALVHWGEHAPLWGMLREEKDPSRRSHVINTLSRASIDPAPLVDRLRREQDPRVRAAILLCLSGYADRSVVHRLHTSTIETVQKIVREDSDPGVYGAASFLLTKSGRYENSKPSHPAVQNPAENSWFVSPTGHTMVVLYPATHDETTQHDNATSKATPVKRPFAIGVYEVTNAQFEAYSGPREPDPYDCSSPDCPAAKISWYQAAAFCNWLSQQEGLQTCYRVTSEEPRRLEPEPDSLSRNGYRLPTSKEWEYACGAGSTTKWFFGDSDELYGEYAWYSENTRDLKKRRVGTKLPNGFGLFDMYGNAEEWCHAAISGSGELRPLRGAAAGDPVRAWTNWSASRGPAYAEVPAIGFRIARTVEK